jgi:uncharacterized protein (TIGR03067 family)
VKTKSPNPVLVKLQGEWNVTALEVDGQSMPASGQVVVKDDRFVSLGMGADYEGQLVVDASQKPAAIDMVFTKGPEKGNINRGIFEFTGTDGWRLCLQMTGGDRPKKFAAKGGGLALQTLERAKAGAVQAKSKAAKAVKLPPDFPTDPIPELGGEWQMMSCLFSGQALEAAYCKMGKRVANGNETAVYMGPQTILKAFYAVDRSKKPNTVDYVLTHGPSSGKKQFGIYELSGGVLKVSFAAVGQPRPSDFGSKAKDGRTVTEWKKIG